MTILTADGTLRNYPTQCANVSKSPQAVISLVKSKHAVCFGLGDDGDQHLIINKATGEINRMRDDGINYPQDMLIIPPDRIMAVMAKLQQNQGDEGGSTQPFTGQGP